MINFIKFFLVVVFIHSFQTSFSQNAAILTGESEAFKENDKVLIKSNAGYSDSVVINKSSFKFSIPVSKGALYSIKRFGETER